MKRLVLSSLCVLFLFVSGAEAKQYTEQNFVQSSINFFVSLNNEILDTSQNKSLSRGEKMDAISNIFDKSIDLPYVGRGILGRNWRLLGKEKQRQYMQTFKVWIGYVLSKKTLDYDFRKAFRIYKIYKGNGYIIINTKKKERVKKSNAHVDSKALFNKAINSFFTVDWYIKMVKGVPKIFDVSVANVSIVLAKRDEFSDVYRRRGIDGIIRLMKRQTQMYMAQ